MFVLSDGLDLNGGFFWFCRARDTEPQIDTTIRVMPSAQIHDTSNSEHEVEMYLER